MTQFFRSGILEYDKTKPKATKACARCGTTIPTRGGKKYCMPCYDMALAENIAAKRHLYRKPKVSA